MSKRLINLRNYVIEPKGIKNKIIHNAMNNQSIEIGNLVGELALSVSRVKEEKPFVKDFAGHLSRYTNSFDGVAKYLSIMVEKAVKHGKVKEREKLHNTINKVVNMDDKEYNKADFSFGFFERFNAVN